MRKISREKIDEGENEMKSTHTIVQYMMKASLLTGIPLAYSTHSGILKGKLKCVAYLLSVECLREVH